MAANRAHLFLRRVHNTLRISVPIEFIRKYGLSEGDSVLWLEEGNSVTLKFVRQSEFDELAEQSAA
jgi:bifunctional DNA-binding transcriptional regulator/antitoxin component of YhaV-PrlF toxin-antitoxin module